MPAEPSSQLIDLALQGGGSHGAFTWGVLDRLLEERWLTIDAISGTSAGAMNAAVMADGMPGPATRARARRSKRSGARSPRPPPSARCSAARSTGCSAAGRSTTRPPTSPST